MISPEVFARKETKYLLSPWQYEALKVVINKNMHPDQFGRSTISSIYFDTNDYRLIRKSIAKPAYKEKLRLRTYGKANEDSKVYLELKKKYKGIVYKRRISMSEKEANAYLSGEIPMPKSSQIAKEIDYFKNYYPNLKPAVVVSCEREAFFGNDDPNLRVTFDSNIRARNYDLRLINGDEGSHILEEGMVLMEAKAANALPLWFVHALTALEIRKTSFSKYGRYYTNNLLAKADNKIYATETVLGGIYA